MNAAPRLLVIIGLASVVTVVTAAQGRSDKWWWDNGGGPTARTSSTSIRSTSRTSASSRWRGSIRTAPAGFNPIVVDDVMYVLGRNSSLVALDATTGKEIWIHEGLSGITSRGINYWQSEDGKDRRLLFCDQQLPAGDRRDDRQVDPDASASTASSTCATGLRARRRHERPRPVEQSRQGLEEPAHPRIGAGRGVRLAAGRHPRLRRRHRQARLAVPHRAAARRVRLRDVAEGRLEVRRRREQLGRDVGRRGARHRLHPDRLGDLRLLRRATARREPLRQLPARARRAHRQAAVALPDGPSRPLGPRQRLGAAARHRAAQRPARRRRRARGQDRLPLRLQPRDRRAALADRRAAGAEERRAGRAGVADAAVPDQAAAVRAADVHASTTSIRGC